MRKGVIYTRKLLTVWYFWQCPWPKPACKTVIKGPNEGFVMKASENHQARHQKVVDDAARKKVRMEQLAWTKGKAQQN